MNPGPFNTNQYPPHNYIPGYPPPHPHPQHAHPHAAYYANAMQQQQQQLQQQPPPSASPSPAAFLSTPDLALITQQGYLAQSQMLAMRQMGLQPGSNQPGAPPPPPGIGMPPQFANAGAGGGQMTPQMQAQMAHMAQLQQQMQMAGAVPGQAQGQGMAGPSQTGTPTPSQSKSHKKKHRPTPAQQMLPQMARQMMPPHGQDHYLRNAMAPPPTHHSREPQFMEVPEPWADAVDELDAREMAMGRFRARHELLAEVFGPDPIKNIPLSKGDPWEGLGMDGETLEAKVAALEKENGELEVAMQKRIAEFERREDLSTTAEITA